ncbi:MAG: hypothetical protein FWD57_16495, partial [Polyangiaceae bacterium]|nr:hypothetical protein [Polyangiaceae bacterium]
HWGPFGFLLLAAAGIFVGCGGTDAWLFVGSAGDSGTEPGGHGDDGGQGATKGHAEPMVAAGSSHHDAL